MGKDKKKGTPESQETQSNQEPWAVVLESLKTLETKQVVYHDEFDPAKLIMLKPFPGEIKKEGEQPIKFWRRRLMYQHDDGYCDFLLAQRDSDKDLDVMTVHGGFKESKMSGQSTYSGGFALPWPSTLVENYNPKKSSRLVDYVNTDPSTRNVTDTLLMVYKRICWLFYKSAQDDPKLAKDVETERDAMKTLKCFIYEPTYKPEEAKAGQFNFSYTPSMFLKIDAYLDKKNPGQVRVASHFYDLKDEEVNIMDHLTQPVKMAPVLAMKGTFTGAKSSIQLSLYEANKVVFTAKSGGRERILRPKVRTADEVASTSQFDETTDNKEDEPKKEHRKKDHKKRRDRADEEY